MTFLDFEIDEKDLASAKFIGETRRGLALALMEAKKNSPDICQAEIARAIGIDKATLSKALNGKSNMTLRTIAEIAWALNLFPVVHYCPVEGDCEKKNHKQQIVSGAHNASVQAHSWGNHRAQNTFVKARNSVKNIRLDNVGH